MIPMPTSLGKALLSRTGHYARSLRHQTFPGVAVLCYHGLRSESWPAGAMVFENLHVPVGEFRAHCDFLQETCHPIALTDWLAAMNGGPALPARPVLMTFDDGYRSVYTLGKPILEQHGMPAVIFVCTEPIEERVLLWYDGAARDLGEHAVEDMKAHPYQEWQAVHRKYARPVSDDDPHAALTINDLKMLAQLPGIHLGCHTGAHPILACASRTEQNEEIAGSKSKLESWVGAPIKVFAYPNGRPGQDYTDETVELVRHCGFEMAFTTRPGFATSKEPPLERSRFLMLSGVSVAELGHRLCYSWQKPQAQFASS
jgi:peptidoglycan/xylan/chitin deacetylase (PgdA/CDA1 family)